MRPQLRLVLRHLAVITAVSATIVWLLRIGDTVGAPPLDIDGMRPWLDQHDSVALAFVIVRLAALCFAAYLLAVSAVSCAARLLALPRTMTVVEHMTLPVLHGLFAGTTAFGVIAVPVAAVPTASAATPVDTTAPQPTDDGQATMHLIADPPEPLPSPAPTLAATHDNTWIVRPGESFWTIASEAVSDHLGDAADDRVIDAYWRRLIDANRDRLANPSDPDLLFADQELVLPAVDG